MVWIVGIFIVCLLVFSLSMSSLANDQKLKEAKIENEHSKKTNLALDAYVDYLKRSPSNDNIKEMSVTEIRHYLSTKLESYQESLKEIKNIDIPWYGGLQHVKGVDTKRAKKRTELVTAIENDGFDIARIEEILGKECSPKPLKRFRIQN